MIILDTSVLVALLLEKDHYHEKAVNLITHLEEQAAMPNSVLVETFGALRHFTKNDSFVATSIKRLAEEHTIIAEGLEVIQPAYIEYFQNFSRLSLIDCELVQLQKQLGIRVLTFDEELSKELEKNG